MGEVTVQALAASWRRRREVFLCNLACFLLPELLLNFTKRNNSPRTVLHFRAPRELLCNCTVLAFDRFQSIAEFACRREATGRLTSRDTVLEIRLLAVAAAARLVGEPLAMRPSSLYPSIRFGFAQGRRRWGSLHVSRLTTGLTVHFSTPFCAAGGHRGMPKFGRGGGGLLLSPARGLLIRGAITFLLVAFLLFAFDLFSNDSWHRCVGQGGSAAVEGKEDADGEEPSRWPVGVPNAWTCVKHSVARGRVTACRGNGARLSLLCGPQSGAGAAATGAAVDGGSASVGAAQAAADPNQRIPRILHRVFLSGRENFDTLRSNPASSIKAEWDDWCR